MSLIAVEKHGCGKPLVLFHGWGFDSQIWKRILPDLLALSLEVYLVDLPGYGRSTYLEWDDFRLELLAILPAQFIISGWSLGGLFASRLAIEAPHRVVKLLSIGSSPYFINDHNWAGISSASLDDFYQRFRKTPELTRQQFVQAQLPKGKSYVVPELGPVNISGLETGLDILKTWDLRDNLKQLQMPVAYLFGRLDKIVSYQLLDNLRALYPNFHYTLLTHSGHMPFLSHRLAFIEWMGNFV